MTPDRIREGIAAVLPEARDFLCDLIRCPSTPGCERDAMRLALGGFKRCASRATRIPLDDALRNDPDYSTPIPDIRYKGRFNVRAVSKGTGGGPTVLFNTHLDVVPPSEDMAEPWNPRIEGTVVHGRGACDAKGQAATIWLVFRALQQLGIRLKGDLVAHIVVEEENGGNGTLAMARRGEKADACIVLEPTEQRILTSIRGAGWFRLVCTGKAGHSGQAGQTKSALLLARDAMAVLERYHAELLAASRGFPLFDGYPNPMPITFGSLQAGNWPASAPSKAVLMGVLGLLPNKTHQQVQAEMSAALAAGLGADAMHNVELTFLYRHDSSVLEPSHEVPQALLQSSRKLGAPTEIAGMTASCDAWFYNNQLRIPSLVYGPGSLKVAHSRQEQIDLNDVAAAACVLVDFLTGYSGVTE